MAAIVGRITHTAIKVVGQAVGLAKGTARVVTGRSEPGPEEPTPKRTAPEQAAPKKAAPKKTAPKKTAPRRGATPTPADVADNIEPATPGSSTEAPADVPAGDPDRPLSAEELAAGAGTETVTPVGTRGADVAHNPDTAETDLQQPGTEPLLDPSTTKAVASEAETLGNAADPDKG